MRQDSSEIRINTRGQGLTDFTNEVCNWVSSTSIVDGMLTIFCRHTSASLTIQENADPDVLVDLENFFTKLVPEGPSLYRHDCEGPDDMPAHIKSALTEVSLSIPVMNSRPVLGTWQGIYLFEHRTHPHQRTVVLQLMGE